MVQSAQHLLHVVGVALLALVLVFAGESDENELILNFNITLNQNWTKLFLKHKIPVIRPCAEENASYCINGLCIFHSDLNTPSCTCHSGFMGDRCGVSSFLARQPYSPEEVISISCGVMLFIICIAVLAFITHRKWCSKPNPQNQKTDSV